MLGLGVAGLPYEIERPVIQIARPGDIELLRPRHAGETVPVRHGVGPVAFRWYGAAHVCLSYASSKWNSYVSTMVAISAAIDTTNG